MLSPWATRRSDGEEGPLQGTLDAITEKILCAPTWLNDAPRDVVSRTRRRRN